jgi:integrase
VQRPVWWHSRAMRSGADSAVISGVTGAADQEGDSHLPQAAKDLKLISQMLGHASTAITEQVYTSVFEDVEREAAESAASLVPRAQRVRPDDAPAHHVPT